MARDYGRIMSAIWNDSDFRTLMVAEQHAYLMLITQPDINSAGILSIALRRWCGYAIDSTPDSLSKALSELAAKNFIAYDEETEELLVRKFVKWDGGSGNTKRQPAIQSAANAIVSSYLREKLAHELDLLGFTHSLFRGLTDSLSEARNPALDSPRYPEPEPEPEPLAVTLDSSSPAPRNRGSRLPENWKPSEADIAWQRGERITDAAARRETLKFRDHFAAASGQNAVKREWSAAWRNWIRRAVDQGTPGGLRPGVAAPVDNSWMDTMPPRDDA